MAEFDFRNAMFHMTLQTLTEAFWHALAAAKDRCEQAEQEMKGHQDSVDAGGDDEEEYEYDEDGRPYLLYSKSAYLNVRWRETDEGIDLIREAFAISLFHTWERSARAWVNCHEQGYDELVKAVKRSGIPFDHQLNKLNDLVNFLKHANKEKDAYYRRVLRGYIGGKTLAAHLTDDHITGFINAIGRSCPKPPDLSSFRRTEA